MKHLFIMPVVGIGLACASCADRPDRGVLVPFAGKIEGTSRVPMLIATTRTRSSTDPGEMYGSGRADEMSFADVTVSIPPDSARKVGDVQWPSALPGDPQRDFVTVSAGYLPDKKAFTAGIAAMAKQTGRSKVLVFVHGFNNKTDDAVYRFAQIVHDSKAPVIPVLFTWPSRGEIRLRAYTYDRESANYSRDALESLLDTLSNDPNVSEITLLAHSMGNWVALEALRGRSIRLSQMAGKARPDKLKSVMLVAPDVDVDVFRTQLQRMGSVRPQMALFVSTDDDALSASKILWGGVARLGDVDPSKEPYQSEFERNRIMVYNLTKLKTPGDDAHDRAFEDVTSVMGMIKKRMAEGQAMDETKPTMATQIGEVSSLIPVVGQQ